MLEEYHIPLGNQVDLFKIFINASLIKKILID